MRKTRQMLSALMVAALALTAVPSNSLKWNNNIVSAAETEITENAEATVDSVVVKDNQLIMNCDQTDGYRWDIQLEDVGGIKDYDYENLISSVVSFLSKTKSTGYPTNTATRTITFDGLNEGKTTLYCILNNGVEVKSVYESSISVDANKNVTIEPLNKVEGAFLMNTFSSDSCENNYKIVDESVASLECYTYINEFYDENGQTTDDRFSKWGGWYSVIFKVIGKKAGSTDITINSNGTDVAREYYDIESYDYNYNITVNDKLECSSSLKSAPSRYTFNTGSFFDGVEKSVEGDTCTATREEKGEIKLSYTSDDYISANVYGEGKKLAVTPMINGLVIDPIDIKIANIVIFVKMLDYVTINTVNIETDEINIPVNKGKIYVYIDGEEYVNITLEDGTLIKRWFPGYSVRYEYQAYSLPLYGGNTREEVQSDIEKGAKLEKNKYVVDKSHQILGYYKDANYLYPWDFENDTVDGNLCLYYKVKKQPMVAKIKKIKAVSKKTKTVTLTWTCNDERNEIYGFDIYYSTNKNLKNAKKVVVNDFSWFENKKTIKKLKKGKTYYFKIVTFCKDENNKKMLGKASKVVKVKVK